MFPKKSMIVMLSNFAKDLGLKDYLALVSAELFIERNKESLDNFYVFHRSNCDYCAKDYNTCDFFFPTKVRGATKLDVLKMNTNSVFGGTIKSCPVKIVPRTLEEGDDKTSFT